MASDGRIGRLRVTITVIAALVFAIVPLPEVVRSARPELLLLLVIYWSLSAPRIAGLTFAWLCGLAMDVLVGVLLGQHALAYLVAAYVTHKRGLQIRIFPIGQQAVVVAALVAVQEFIVFWIDGYIGQPVTTWKRWLPVLTSALLWPVVVAVLDTWNRRSR